jgi:hypothetical protein
MTVAKGSGTAAGAREMAPKSAATTAMTSGKADTLKTCHPSVCVGDAKPTSCVCPTTQKK